MNLWYWALWPFIFVGTIMRKYYQDAREYFDYELPSDRECDDVSNKNKWLHKYTKT